MTCTGSGIMPASADPSAMTGTCVVCHEVVDLEPLNPDDDASILVAAEHATT